MSILKIQSEAGCQVFDPVEWDTVVLVVLAWFARFVLLKELDVSTERLAPVQPVVVKSVIAAPV